MVFRLKEDIWVTIAPLNIHRGNARGQKISQCWALASIHRKVASITNKIYLYRHVTFCYARKLFRYPSDVQSFPSFFVVSSAI